jgi:hypothetical protein
MGFLNHSTNNIIIDAVLTERGREVLSRNDGTFSIESFSFGDDEIDYGIIKKYGFTIGQEKIEKNTPIFEANPNENIAIKHPLITLTNGLLKITEIPTLIWDNRSSGQTVISLFDIRQSSTNNVGVQDNIIIKSFLEGQTEAISSNLVDNKIFVKVNSNLLSVLNSTPLDVDINNVATYALGTSSPQDVTPQWPNQISKTITINSLGIVSDLDFQQFASLSNPNVINTSVQIIGASSGASLVIPVQITKNTTTA